MNIDKSVLFLWIECVSLDILGSAYAILLAVSPK